MKNKITLDKISFQQLLTPIICVVFLVFLREYLLESPLPEALTGNRTLLTFSLSAVAAVVVAGCLYSYLFKARIHAFICASCILVGIGISYHFFFQDFSKYLLFILAGLFLASAVYLIYRRINALGKVQFFLCSVAVLLLLLANALFGTVVNGARLWIPIGSFTFQPSELIKVLLILLGASAFGSTRRSTVYCILSILSCGTLLLLRDLGGVAVLFCLFVVMVYLLFDNKLLSIGLICAAAIALYIAVNHLDYASTRIDNWGKAMSNPDSQQQRNYIIALLLGGYKGLGVAHYSIFTRIFGAVDDGALAGVMAILGQPVAAVTLGAYAALTAQSAFNKSVYTSSFLLLVQLGVYIATHVLLNLLGSTDILPLTGVVAPFISGGGTATLCFGILLGLGAAALNPRIKPYLKQ